MKLDELTSLIQIRDYLASSQNNGSIDRKTLGEMSAMLLLIDKKIIKILQSPEFKDYVDYGSARQALIESRQLNNGVFEEANRIKSGLKSK